MSDELDSLPDQQLAEAFARDYLGCAIEDGMMRGRDEVTGGILFESWKSIPPFATSLNAVLPWLESSNAVVHFQRGGCRIMVGGVETISTFPSPRSACIALIRAKRAQRP